MYDSRLRVQIECDPICTEVVLLEVLAIYLRLGISFYDTLDLWLHNSETCIIMNM